MRSQNYPTLGSLQSDHFLKKNVVFKVPRPFSLSLLFPKDYLETKLLCSALPVSF